MLDGLETINVCVGYELPDGQVVENVDVALFDQIKPVYKTLKGWDAVTFGAKSLDALPQEALDYIAYIESFVGIPVDIVSTGPDRCETIIKRDVFA